MTASDRRTIRRTVLVVAALNLGYFFVEAAVALAIGWRPAHGSGS